VPSPKLDSSVELVAKAQSGDSEALDALLIRYLPRLRRWARGRLPWGLRTMLDTGDLVQEAVIKALPHLGAIEIRTDRAVELYLQKAVSNRILDLKRRSRRRPTRDEMPEDVRAADASPQEVAVAAEAFEQFQAALAALKPEESRAIKLRIEMGLDYDQVAARLGKPSADAARMAVSRAIMRLAEQMGRRKEPGANTSRKSKRGRKSGSPPHGSEPA
jgi:RNA polymerase sigma-70 factor, ECF subfamily